MPQMTLAPVGLSRRKPPNYAYDTYAPKRPPKPKDQSPKPKSQLPIKNWARRRVANYSGWWLETEDIDTDAVCLKHSINGIVSDWLMRDLKKAQCILIHPEHTHTHTHLSGKMAHKQTCHYHNAKRSPLCCVSGHCVTHSRSSSSRRSTTIWHSWGGEMNSGSDRMRHSHSAPVKHTIWRQFVCA